ncbi:unnamed protein product [Penicillium egyptiacum]|uniref:Cytochrome P450 n=1 Tax=Penicillium egyptiacum TaxID=1303716 RepID=A0A9W4KJI5_9EURO|nr:unnamed protein product [Penicillium egyptiacum]
MFSPLIAGIVVLLLFFVWNRLIYHRTKQYAGFPQTPPSRIWGHLSTLIQLMKTSKSNSHFDEAFKKVYDRLGSPPAFLLDLRPFSSPICVVCRHEVAEQITTSSKLFQYSLPKSRLTGLVSEITGLTSIILAEDNNWKALRKQLNPGFSHSYTVSLVPCILDKTKLFLANLDHYASTGEDFSLDHLCTNLTFDIMGAVTMDTDMDAQLGEKNQTPIVRLFRELTSAFNYRNGISVLLPSYKRCRLVRHLDKHIKQNIKAKFEEQKANPQNRSRSVLSLSLAEQNDLTSEILDQTCDQLKTFLLAGHDTTSILLQWTFYELSRNIRILGLVRLELDELFGPESSPIAVRDKILENTYDFLQNMSYTSAVIKETLRLHPPAATARHSPPNTGFNVRLPSGQTLCLDGLVLYNCQSIIHQDSEVYGDNATEFIPERWLEASEIPIPPSAWRPFERGPRRCIGQEFTNIEALVVIASVIRRYSWEKVGLGATKCDDSGERIVKANGQYELQSELYNTMELTAKPVDGMRMRVRMAETWA